MKKLLCVMAVACFVFACNNANQNPPETDSVTVDTMGINPAPMDTTMSMPDTGTVGKADSAIRK